MARFIAKRLVKRSLLSAAALALAVQFVPYGHSRINPPTIAEPAWDAPVTRALAERACFDCHSNQTRWPAYARIAPVSWLVQHDVTEGRAELNFSEWQRPQRKSSDAAAEIRDREMPPVAYRLMHSRARLTVEERDALARGLFSTLNQGSRQDEAEISGR
jgi:hypothetical protein